MRIAVLLLLVASVCACARTKKEIAADPAPSNEDAVAQAKDARSEQEPDAEGTRFLVEPIAAPPTTGAIVAHGEDLSSFGAAVSVDFGRCFAEARTRDHDVAGVITVRFSVRVDGGVDAPAAGGKGIDDRALLKCVVAVVRRVRFDPPPRSFDARSYAFAFSGA